MEQKQSSAIAVTQTKTGIQSLWITLFALFTAVGAQIEIPHQPVPFTMQTLFVLLAGALLGKEKGAMSQLLYLALGAVGVPVFSHFGFGFARIFGPTGGYLLSFPVAAFVVGYLVHKNKNFFWILLSMLTGLFIIFSLGTVQLYLVYFHNWSDAFVNGFLIFSWWDIIKLSAAASIYHQIAKRGLLKQ
jgi:biotin transport system substrate-specific component